MKKKITLYIDGMVCGNCEKRIETAFAPVDGVEKIKADFKKSKVEILYEEEKFEEAFFRQGIEKLGYGVLDKPPNALSGIVPWMILLLAGFYLIQHTIGFNFIPTVSAEMGYGLIFIIGALTSIHCIAMCGGIALSQSVNATSQKRKFMPSLLYNLGRVVSYTIVGGIVGGLGQILTPSGQFKGSIAILAGIFMFFLGLKMLNVLTFPQWLRFRLPVFNVGVKHTNSPLRPLFVGLMNGFMPCGPLQTMQLYALGTGSVIQGALSMFYFSLGTVPLMFGFGLITSIISGQFGKKMMKVSAVLVMVLGVMMLNRGFALSGIGLNAGFTQTAVGQVKEIPMEDGKQIVNMTVDGNGYTLDVGAVKVGVPVKIKLDVLSINGCNNPLVIPAYGIEKDMTTGEPVIEFTPDKEGTITISCWMGMITTQLQAVNDPTQANIAAPGPSTQGGSCGMGSGGGCH